MRQLFAAVLLILFAGSAAHAQRGGIARKRPELIPLEGQARRVGFYIDPGITYTLTRFKDKEEEVFRSGDTVHTATYSPDGRLGLYLGAGLTWYTRDPVVVDYFDLGLAYKNLRGAESLTGTYQRADSTFPVQGEGSFAERMLTVNVNANKFIRTADYQFVQVSLGGNLDYRLGSSYEHTGDSVLNAHRFPPDLIGQLHFRVGYGFKVTGRLLLIPTLETPVFSITPTDTGFGQLEWFSSRYRPLIFTIRLLFLRARSGFDCPPPIKHNAMEKGRTKTYKPDSYHP
ncbi:MAG: hypothetical protein JNM31_11655 [Flavobacteriales bacterium]|nr:hypothetical protein [Flavobacteriales bacterium]